MKGLIIGFGNMGQTHLDRYQQLGASVVAVIDSDNLKRIAAEEKGIVAYASLDEYVQTNGIDDIDFVDICLPTDLHFSMMQEIATKFADRPIPICVEKPVVRTADEAEDLNKILVNFKSLIFVAECEHYNKRITNFLASVKNPKHITISRMVNLEYFLKGARPWFLDAKRSGGLILDLMIHDLSLLDNIGGHAVITNCRSKNLKFNCIDEATLALQYANFTAEITGSWLSDDMDHPIVTTLEITDEYEAKHQLIIDDYLRADLTDHANDPYYLELQAFLDAVVLKEVPHQLEEYLRVVQLANHAIELVEAKLPAAPLVYFNSTLKSEVDPNHTVRQQPKI
jgi:predicted dehydrogenase